MRLRGVDGKAFPRVPYRKHGLWTVIIVCFVFGVFIVMLTGVIVEFNKEHAQHILQVESESCGARCYLAVSGGINTPLYLGSRSTFPGGKLGGVQVCVYR